MKKDNSRKEEKQREIVGIDLGDKVSHYAVINEEGEVVEEGTFRNQTTSIDKHFRGQPRRIALEVGAPSAWISRQLQQLGHEVIVANARQVRWITASDQKSDRMDAKKLAWLARADVRC
jgi:transposase